MPDTQMKQDRDPKPSARLRKLYMHPSVNKKHIIITGCGGLDVGTVPQGSDIYLRVQRVVLKGCGIFQVGTDRTRGSSLDPVTTHLSCCCDKKQKQVKGGRKGLFQLVG